MSITLTTVEDALTHLGELQEGREPEPVEFAGELAKLHIRIEGLRYHSTLPGELARGLWHLQEEIYSAAAFALTGMGDIRKLTAEQRSAFELVFEVKEGSSDFWAAIGGFLEKLGEGFSNMDSAAKTKTIIVVALLIAGGYGFRVHSDTIGDIRKEEIKAQQAVANEEQQTKQMEIFAKALAGSREAKKFEQAITEGTRAIARSASDADEIDIGRTKISAEGIQELNRRTPRVPTSVEMLDTNFRIFKVDVREVGEAKYVLAGPGTGEFVATLTEANFEQTELGKVLQAAQRREEIRLEVLIARNKMGIRSAQIVQVLEPTKPPPLPKLPL